MDDGDSLHRDVNIEQVPSLPSEEPDELNTRLIGCIALAALISANTLRVRVEVIHADHLTP